MNGYGAGIKPPAEAAGTVFGLIGLCERAGELVSGEAGSLAALRGGKAALAFIDRGASANLLKRFTDACAYRNVPLTITDEGRLSSAIGKPGRMIAVIKPCGLAEKLLSSLEDRL